MLRGWLPELIVCAYTRNTYCASNFLILYVTSDVKIHPCSQENPSNVTRPSSLRFVGVESGDETNIGLARKIDMQLACTEDLHFFINPQCAYAARVTVLCLCVCLCVYTYFRTTGNEVDGECYQRLQRCKRSKNEKH